MPRTDAHAKIGCGASPVASKGKSPMAVRHDVENLIRRGNIFYWRTHIPSSFVQSGPAAGFHSAFIVPTGRKLNMRLAELKMNSKDIMSIKAQLQKLLEHVRDEALKELEGASTAAS
jgi:hypothetical protein